MRKSCQFASACMAVGQRELLSGVVTASASGSWARILVVVATVTSRLSACFVSLYDVVCSGHALRYLVVSCSVGAVGPIISDLRESSRSTVCQIRRIWSEVASEVGTCQLALCLGSFL